ncbi:MAG: CheY-like chemotaxis protein [Flavobacteriales bacterium]|jgi:CheY-like chemotaxis protein
MSQEDEGMEEARTILTIDDSPTNQKLIQRILAPAYKVVQADSGFDGLEMLDHVAPNLILLDVDMPGIDGYDTCREIRRHKGYESVPILFYSCLTEPKAHLQGYEAGADDYINKPVDIDILRAKVAINLDKSCALQKKNPRPTLVQFDEIRAQFLDSCIFSRNPKAVADALFSAGETLGLELSVRLHQGRKRDISNISPLSTLEDILLDRAEDHFPIQNSTCFIAGSDHIVLLVRNIRLLGEAMQTQYQNCLSSMISAANERIQQLTHIK